MNKVEAQYQTPRHLDTRISIHEKYSVNRRPFSDWLLEQYDLPDGVRVLELGCGTGELWKGHLPQGIDLTLSDCSRGMLARAEENLGQCGRLHYVQIDIQKIPYPNHSFDRVIANMMLYHVTNLNRALAEVKRVLKEDGIFYCATFGKQGLPSFVAQVLSQAGIDRAQNNSFTLENGAGTLKQHFSRVERQVRDDALDITDPGDLADYILSLTFLQDAPLSREKLLQILKQYERDGHILIPKEYGTFLCQN